MGIREQIVNTAIRYNGMSFKGGSHRTLIDEFNKYKPDGWAMTYTANFCAACASAIAYLCGVGDSYPCSANVGTIVKPTCLESSSNLWSSRFVNKSLRSRFAT